MKPGWFVRGDIDGFFGLFVDNLLQLMLIAVLCTNVCGMPPDLVYGKIMPGAALSILVGNLFYAWQARRLAIATGRMDVTALPYGINTVSLIAFVFLIIAPIYFETRNPNLAWQAGLFACLAGAVLELIGAFVGDWLRKHTPRAALLSCLAGIAITFISMGFVFQIFAMPAIALVPALFVIFIYGGQVKLPLGVPGGFVAVALGVAMGWILRWAGYPFFNPSPEPYQFALHLPQTSFAEMLAFLTNGQGWKYFSVIFPMALFNVIGSLQNLESAEAAGDRFDTRSSLLVNGFGSIVAACLGNPFPTTIYIGHPGWKAMGARWGYSILNGAVITILCLIGGVTLVLKVVPLEAMIGILLWIGMIITAQAFQEVPKRHSAAVALGLMPALAAWALLLVETALRKAGASLYDIAPKFGGDLYIYGIISISQGFMLTCMILSAIMVHVVEREFLRGALWTTAAAILSFFGIIHAYVLTPAGVQNSFGIGKANGFAAAYLIAALILVLLHYYNRGRESERTGIVA
ncbi:permease [Geobacter sp. DSM 9736]|uniref:permease n=1 Tax=Geobacter sp. DSM 9736 TaxID=1277350 RepID=UPI000B5052C0|nr:permease [Geobacter sp. DSM 9736]SNB46838.1 putative MFS transporter, AGZA family, xanthine/uracil permease [Geobacter sp. DSM 9736]